MGCGSCSNGGVPNGCKSNGSCGAGGCNKLSVFDWLSDMELPSGQAPFDCFEIRFKNGRKDFYRNTENLSLAVGDVIAVESSPGHDIGVVSIAGELTRLQMRKKKIATDNAEIKKIYRKGSQNDIDKWKDAQSREENTMRKAREFADYLKLNMKISDVEYQGDLTKATFYYTAEERVDFRELIKKLADEFKIRVEMRQIGARQEASRIGGFGSCGRELCCTTWLSDFRSVSTSAARYQQLSLNPQKLAGQCGKLKCCLNFELDTYMDALKEFPDTEKPLQTEKGRAFFQKMDIFKRLMWYSYESAPGAWIGLSLDRVTEIVDANKRKEKPTSLEEFVEVLTVEKLPDFENVVGQDSLTRFDNSQRKGKGGNKNKRKPSNKPSAAPKAKTGNSPEAKKTQKADGEVGEKPKSNNNNRNRNKRKGPRPAAKNPNNNGAKAE